MTQAQPEDGLFRVVDDVGGIDGCEDDETTRFLPTGFADGPWNPSHPHGSAVSGLRRRAACQYASAVPMRLARITVEMFRGVPMSPLRIQTRILRAGRRIQSVIDFSRADPPKSGEPATVRVRLRCRLTEGEETAPSRQLARLADFASETGSDMNHAKYTSINSDLTIRVLREPRSEWLGIRGLTRRAGDGIGQSSATIHDLEGPIANVSASPLLDRR